MILLYNTHPKYTTSSNLLFVKCLRQDQYEYIVIGPMLILLHAIEELFTVFLFRRHRKLIESTSGRIL